MKNVTRNHHFVAQVEQRLNSIDPSISKKNQRIYSFNIVDRENYKLDLMSENGERIEDNLSFDDLFSFEILNENQRLNLEQAFGRYEQSVGDLTRSLLEKIKVNDADIKEEVLGIFSLKLINTFRNPYCIEKTLNTIGQLSNYSPTDIELKKLYEKIDVFEHPHGEDIEASFAVSVESYKKWMKSLFMILVPEVEQGRNILELTVKGLIENSESLINVFINDCSGVPNAHPLLSDRGFTLLTDSVEHTAYEFNLSSSAFISYVFTDIKAYAQFTMDAELIQRIISLNEKRPSEVRVHVIRDEPEALSRYNKNVIYQSFNTVFCKSKVVHSL
ncbi:MAG: hypothetical protein ACRCYN_03700 [Plesiomonas sp.]